MATPLLQYGKMSMPHQHLAEMIHVGDALLRIPNIGIANAWLPGGLFHGHFVQPELFRFELT